MFLCSHDKHTWLRGLFSGGYESHPIMILQKQIMEDVGHSCGLSKVTILPTGAFSYTKCYIHFFNLNNVEYVPGYKQIIFITYINGKSKL